MASKDKKDEVFEPDVAPVVEVEEKPKPVKAKTPTETLVLQTICDWLEGFYGNNLPETAAVHDVRLNVADRNFNLAWQRLIPLIEGKRGKQIV